MNKTTIHISKLGLKSIFDSHFILHFSFFIILTSLTSCLIEIEQVDAPIVDGIETEVTISIAVPFPVLTTKSLTAAEEETINSIELLIFDAAGKYQYTSNATDITINTVDSNIRDFRALLKTGTADILLLANSRNILNNHYPTGIPEGTDKEDIAKKLTLTISDKWITDTTDNNYQPIPMWGEIGLVTITNTPNTLGNTPFDMHRMVARVDVTTSLPVGTDFKLTSVRLYHYNDIGRLIPISANFNTDKPSIPTEATQQKGPIIYDGTAIQNDENGNPACIREIYLFEAIAGSRFTHPENVCLVVGAEYKGIPGFYRIDFQKTTTQGKTYLDILRNHHYQVIINSVLDIGFPGPDEALEAYPVSLEAQIIDWQDNNNDDISIGGQYILRLSTDELVFNPAGGTQLMYIYTNHPMGWKFVEAGFVPTVNWITFNPVAGTQGTLTEVKVTVTENTDPNLRFYEIPLVVDNIKKDLIFAQRGTADVDLEVYVTPNPLLLGKMMTSPVEITVSTYPAGIPLYFEYQGDIAWMPGFGIPTDGTANRTFQLWPVPNSSDGVITGFLTVYVKDAAGRMASCIVDIQQVTKITGFNAILNNPYPAVSGEYTFQIESTVPWLVDYVSQGSIWTPSFGYSLQNATALSDRKFTLTNNPLYQTRNIDVSIHAPESGEYETLEFEQDFIIPQLITTGGTQITLPSAGGETVKYKFTTNADWTVTQNSTWTTTNTLYSNITSSLSGTGVAYDLKEYEIDFQTIAYNPTSTATLKAGTIMSGTVDIEIKNYSPYTLQEPDSKKSIIITRVVPPLVTPNTASIQSVNVHTGTVGSTRTGTGNYNRIISCGEQNLRVSFYANTSFEAWTSFDPSNKTTYTHSSNYLTSTPNMHFAIPENNTGANRDFILYIQPAGSSEIQELLFQQVGTRVKVTLLSSTNVPTGGLDIKYKVEDPDGVLSSSKRLLVTFLTGGDYIENMTNMLSSPTRGFISAPGEYSLALRPHPGTPQANREVMLIYAIELINNSAPLIILGNSHTVAKLSQDYKIHQLPASLNNLKISRSTIVDNTTAGYYVQPQYNWTTAMGISEDYLTNSLWDIAGYTYTNFPTLSGSQMPPYSCEAYSEPDHPTMKWRLPTREELKYMYDNRETIGGFHIGSTPYNASQHFYWSIEEYEDKSTTWQKSIVHGFDFLTGDSDLWYYKERGKFVTGYAIVHGRARCVEKR